LIWRANMVVLLLGLAMGRSRWLSLSKASTETEPDHVPTALRFRVKGRKSLFGRLGVGACPPQYVAAATIGRRVARLEDEIGLTIFERGRFGIRLSTGGKAGRLILPKSGHSIVVITRILQFLLLEESPSRRVGIH
jgi:hypothetical protein